MRFAVGMLAMLLGLLAAVAAFPGESARALPCVQRGPEQLVAGAEAVALARVLQEAPRNANRVSPVLLAVERVYKGTLGPQIVVMHNPMVGPDINLEQGKPYLLFLRWNQAGQRVTSICDGTREWTGSRPGDLAAVLGAGAPPAGASDPYGVEERPGANPLVWVPLAGLAIGACAGYLWWRRRSMK